MLLRSNLYAWASGMAVRPVVLEAMFMSILLEVGAGIEKLKNPGGSKEPEGIEKLLQLPSLADVSTCQTTIEATLQQEAS
jgi:hypothetical protein